MYYYFHFLDEGDELRATCEKRGGEASPSFPQEDEAQLLTEHECSQLLVVSETRGQTTRDLQQTGWAKSSWVSSLAFVGLPFYFTSCHIITYPQVGQEAKWNGEQLNLKYFDAIIFSSLIN